MTTELTFNASITIVESQRLIVLPADISQSLPSRGMVMAQIQIDQTSWVTALEPDGRFSHWFLLPDDLTLEPVFAVALSVVDEWPEPEIPTDIWEGLLAFGLDEVWQTLTTKSKWSWLRWIRATNNPDTRKKRIGVAADKLLKGNRRPCCFDQTRCTIPELAKSGQLKL